MDKFAMLMNFKFGTQLKFRLMLRSDKSGLFQFFFSSDPGLSSLSAKLTM